MKQVRAKRSRRSRLWKGAKEAGGEGCASCGCDVLSCVTVLVAGVATVAAARTGVAVARRGR